MTCIRIGSPQGIPPSHPTSWAAESTESQQELPAREGQAPPSGLGVATKRGAFHLIGGEEGLAGEGELAQGGELGGAGAVHSLQDARAGQNRPGIAHLRLRRRAVLGVPDHQVGGRLGRALLAQTIPRRCHPCPPLTRPPTAAPLPAHRPGAHVVFRGAFHPGRPVGRGGAGRRTQAGGMR